MITNQSGFKMNMKCLKPFVCLVLLPPMYTALTASWGYFIKLPVGATTASEASGVVTANKDMPSTMCIHECFGSATCRYIANDVQSESCVLLNDAPPPGMYGEVFARIGYVDCLDAQRQGIIENAIISIQSSNDQFDAFCDMQSDGGGWLVIQRRMNGKTSFNRGWSDYQKGFGNLNEEFWLGLDNIHALTNANAMELKIDLKSIHGEAGYARYSTFKVASGLDAYRLTIGGYNGTIGDAMDICSRPTRTSNGQRFSTYDRDNDGSSSDNCAASKTGGWWFNQCYYSHLNGMYGVARDSDKYMTWLTWKPDPIDLVFSEMKIRPIE